MLAQGEVEAVEVAELGGGVIEPLRRGPARADGIEIGAELRQHRRGLERVMDEQPGFAIGELLGRRVLEQRVVGQKLVEGNPLTGLMRPSC